MADPFATVDDLADRWRPLTADEQTRAAVLLADASRMVRRRWRDIDARIAAGEIDADDVRMVVAGMVERHGLVVDGAGGVTEQTEAAGPFQVTRRFNGPTGRLYFGGDDIDMLDPVAGTGGRRAFVIDLTPGT